ncbi:MAG: BatA domain-containing protein, partial [Planctomycetes bacterium]|nr:BatA domain-containing protein [Planctomycetota bacterium]
MTLLAPWFLIGLLAVAIPLILHLRRSRRAQKIVFSTTQFFDEQFIRSARRARVQDLLLLALRMALLALFVLALAQPLIRTPGLAGLIGGGGRRVAIVLDDSASMTAAGERGTLFDRARAGALAILDELSPAAGDK